MNKKLIFTAALHTALAFSWSGDDKKTGQNLDFYGELESQQGHVEKVNNIRIGRDGDSAKMKQISMYEKPKGEQQKDRNENILLSVNPHSDLIQSMIDLDEINAIEVPHPKTTWRLKTDRSNYAVEYIEVVITAKNGDVTHYLLELGREDTKRPTKVFCSSVHRNQDVDENGMQAQPKLFCTGVSIHELEEKGVPFPAIKRLHIEGYCHRTPQVAAGS